MEGSSTWPPGVSSGLEATASPVLGTEEVAVAEITGAYSTSARVVGTAGAEEGDDHDDTTAAGRVTRG